MKTKTLTKRINRFLALVLTIAALTVGQSAWATTKTVTYTLSRVEVNTSHYWALTHSGDTPFDGTTTVENQLEDYHTQATFTLPDGFTFNFTWGSGAIITSIGSGGSTSYFQCQNNNVKFSLSWSGTRRYVTNVSITDDQGNPSSLNGSGTATTDYNYAEQGSASYILRTYASFVRLNITYTDVPGVSIFESDGVNAYKINSKNDLRHLAELVNNGNNCSGLTFRQTTDITCDNTYTPIGYFVNNADKSPFEGTYDGGGLTISGITVNRTANYVGLFGYIGTGGTVKNVILASSTFSGKDEVGGIAGGSQGDIRNCRVESAVTINASDSKAYKHGGIVGLISGGTVTGCISAASITNNSKSNCAQYGGIAGYLNTGTVSDCLYTGTNITADNEIGAIVGYKRQATLTNNYYTNDNAPSGVGGGDENGARRARTVTLGEGVSIIGDQTAYDVSGLTAIGTTALKSGTTIYSGATQTLTLDHGDRAGYTFSGYTANSGTINGNSLFMHAADVTVSATWTPTFTGMTLETINNKLTATFDGSSLTTVNIPIDITVESVVLNREFTVDKPATIMLPFAIDVANTSGAAFYTYTGVSYDTNTNKWVATMTQVTSGTIAANTPYLVVPSATSITFTGGATLNTTTNSEQTTIGDWAFKGTYAQKTWAAADCGRDYGFAATSGKATDGVTAVQAGDFVKLAAGAWIRPMRSYLTYTGNGNPFAAPKHRAGTELPQSISVILVSANGETTSLTPGPSPKGEGSEYWYDMSGRKLSSKPRAKGLYIRNGRKTIIK